MTNSCPKPSISNLVYALIGAAIGVGAVVLQALGNPPSMGLCVGCFMRDIAGAVGLHRAEVGQYIRPEAAGILMGALLAALLGGKGCPLRQLVRSGEGDGDAAMFCTSMIVGAGICHNWSLVATPDRMVNGALAAGGPTAPAQWAVVAGFAFCVLSVVRRRQGRS
jgi:hypothetical protein